MDPRSLLAVIDTAQISGPGRQLVALLAALRDRGTDARLLTFHRTGRPPSPFVPFAEASGIPVTVVPERGRFDPAVVTGCREILRRFPPAVVQTHSYKATVVAWRLRRSGHPFRWVGCFHGTTAENLAVRLYHRLDVHLLRGADHIVLASESQRRLLGRRGHRAVVIDNAVLPPPSLAVGPEGAGPPVTFGYLGRLSWEKGVDVLLRAVATLRERSPGEDWSLLVAGDGPEREALERQAAHSGLGGTVRFVGRVTDPWEIYRQVRCVVLPSRSEGLPNVLLEAMAADRTVVATTVGAIPEVLGPSGAGLLVPPDHPAELASAMQEAIRTAASPERATARAEVRRRYSPERRLQGFLELYRQPSSFKARTTRAV